MTGYEFEAQYKKLEETNIFYSKKSVKELVAEAVKDLDYQWFKRLVERIILNPSHRVDIGEAARTEKQARRAVSDTKAMSAAFEGLKCHISEDGLSKALESFGVNSLMDAIRKKS